MQLLCFMLLFLVFVMSGMSGGLFLRSSDILSLQRKASVFYRLLFPVWCFCAIGARVFRFLLNASAVCCGIDILVDLPDSCH